MFFCFAFVVTFSDLLFNFFGDQIDRCIEVVFTIFSVEIWAWDGEAHGALKLPFGYFSHVMG